MAYTAGDIILDTHYNQFADTDVNTLWGQGTGQSGYGQSSTLSTVSDGVTVTATQWANLLNKISTISSHQGSSITSITNPTTGDVIEIFNALQTNITTIQTNKLTAAGYGSSTDSALTANASWTTLTTHTARITFAGGDEARYFFNSGGKIQITFDISGGTSDSKYNEWDALATACGTYEIYASVGGKTGGSGTPDTNLTTTGYYDLPTTEGTLMFKQFEDTSPYTTNYIQVTAWTTTEHSDARDNNGETLTIKVEYADASADQTSYDKSIYNVLDQIDGTVTTTFKLVPPATTYISNTWGVGVWSTITNTQS